ncbi:superoxide dismutase [Candidatus Shapirobacteria bacterium]|nr:superoxide dismutase [Candidatus Shapirobacteria bacterium]
MFKLNPLPYAYEALEPVISRKIMELHHDKHHAAYVTAANVATEKLAKARAGEIEIDTRAVMRDFSFNANGAMMHDIFWNCMRAPTENNLPTGKMLEEINRGYGSFEAFKKEFTVAATTVEGSGWAVMYKTPEVLTTGQLEKHNLMALNGCLPILALDVWEHAYYLDYLNDRKTYVEKWWSLVNWEAVEKML